jgi:hypothetical protein
MATHVKVIAVLFIVFGILGVLGAFFSSIVFGLLASFVGASHEEGSAVGLAVLGLTGAALTVVLLFISVPGIICGWGLLKLRPWARILGIVLAAISLIRFPIGTIFGAYALVILFQKDAEALFAATNSPTGQSGS